MIELERSLSELGRMIDYPATDVSARVIERLRSESARVHRPRWIRPLLAAAAVLVVVATIVAAIPQTREAVADFLGLGGVRIRVGGPTPTPSASAIDLGEAVSLEEAQARVDFDVRVPDALGGPPQVFFDPLVPGGQVALLYPPEPGLPPAPGTNAGALVTQFPGSTSDEMVKKFAGTEPGTRIVPVNVAGAPGYFISGEPHVIAYLGPDGQPREETVRLAGNVLLWSDGGVTYRIESLLSRPEALRVAASLR